MPQPPIGIDLGTTYSAVAYLDEVGRPITIPNAAGDLLTPSALLFEEGEIIIGKEAMRESVVSPLSYAECFKRDMGSQTYRRTVKSQHVPPEVLSGFLLERLRHDAEARMGPIQKVVITVPAFFDETRRKATQDAGRLAGLEVLDIINEPTAAAIAFGWQQKAAGAQGKRRILVYDLGGGTFDVTILEIEGNQFRAVATDGDVQLGGKDWDGRLVDYMAQQFLQEHGVDPRSDPQDAAQLWLDAQELKHTLSERGRARAMVHHAGLRQRLEVDRAGFDELTADLLARTETTTNLIVKDAGLKWSDIDDVLLVGGSSRMPQVSEMLRRLTGKEPNRSASPDEAVAHGAALYCGILMGHGGSGSGYKLVNVNSHSLGVVGMDTATNRKTNVILIPKNSALPCQETKLFRTAKSGQRSVVVPVVEGESRRPEDCIALGKCVVRGLPDNLPQGTMIHVTYKYQSNGRIAVTAHVPAAGQFAEVEIQREEAQTLESLDTWRERLGAKSSKPAAPRPAHAPKAPSNVGHVSNVPPPPDDFVPLATPAPPQPMRPPAPAPMAPAPMAPAPMAPAPMTPASPSASPSSGAETKLAPAPPPPGQASSQAAPGSGVAAPTSGGPADRKAVIRQLDNLYAQFGRIALQALLSGDLERWRQAAVDAERQLLAAEQRMRSAEAGQKAADGTPDSLRLASEAAKARTEAEQLRKRRDFSLVVLGRECVSAKIKLPGAENFLAQAERLRTML